MTKTQKAQISKLRAILNKMGVEMDLEMATKAVQAGVPVDCQVLAQITR
jgi:hypothetical protein